jgi:hypothetical protein
MADSTIDTTLVHFKDNWPDGEMLSAKNCGFDPRQIATSAAGHNTVAPSFPVGTKVNFYHPGVAGKAGPCRFVYLGLGTQVGTLAAKGIVMPVSATVWYTVSNNSTCVAVTSGCGAVALGAMTNDYYGWFLCGGVVPTDFVAALTGNFATTGLVTAGAFGTKAGVTATTVIVLGPKTTLMGVFGYALATDAA